MRVSVHSTCPAETALPLRNPDRGLYAIAGFAIADDMADPQRLVDGLFVPEGDDLVLVEVNVAAYAAGPISDAGLAHLDALFDALVRRGHSLVVRPLYDWDGRCQAVEPRELDVVCNHADQLGGVLGAYGDSILCWQGLMVGNWGEMHGTRFDDRDLAAIYERLRAAVGPEAFLCVRTPGIWRMLATTPTSAARMARLRLGLFNDGMFGSVSDLGTYRAEDGALEADARERELAFQERLCLVAPNGGEVVGMSPLSDFDRAVADLRRMRVTYLNRTHDVAVLDKWARHVVVEEGPWQGSDGLSYVEGHLGYRLAITQVEMHHGSLLGRLTRSVSVRVRLTNRGFAPLYRPASAWVAIRGADGSERRVRMDGDVEPGTLGPYMLVANLPLSLFAKGESELRIALVSERNARPIHLAHEGDGTVGYLVGKVVVS